MLFLHLTACLLLASSSVLAQPQYFGMDTWSPQQIAAYLDQYRQGMLATPEEDVNFSTDHLGLGTVSAVDVDSNGDLFIFHRADRPWDYGNTFGANNVLTKEAQTPVASDTIVKVNPDDARLITSFGKNFFNVPHGLKVDSNDNLWVTDVGRHQVFRFPENSTTPDLTLGEKFRPGSDDSHFCKPTDVAVASTGEFFVSDGYCNSRVLKYSKEGKLITQWGTPSNGGRLTPFSLNIPHSLTLIEKFDLVCVADRENQRSLCYNAGLPNGNGYKAGSFNRTLIPQGDIGKVFAIYYNSADNTVIASSDGQVQYPARAATYNLAGEQTDEWANITPRSAQYGSSLIHDLCASPDGRHFYLADLLQQRVLRYTMTERPIYLPRFK
ncbi:peptidyl-glycine alpha-amidating monooxygenase [Elysia marginata]|uniref:peptidylamidoglycolate lyase n=1 Tax=Elysia marginata TaxID=1093978 RepID=A0AAV4HMF4_9GAST|nr:peptidyl-glycine alpha-amidating monooxygenase [Elysia marginata]